MPSLTQKQTEYFWGKVDKEKSKIFYNGSRCWEWKNHCEPYGRIKIKGRSYNAHRISYELTYGEIPDKLMVCHHCDNPPCCNPNHLFLGTHQDNSDDKMKKGRGNQPRGERNPSHKLTKSQVDEIRKIYSSGKESQTKIAKTFGVSQYTIHAIVNYERWIS